MRVITFFSQISRSGKTVACVNLAVALARLGRRVLVIDLDGQAEASLAFGVAVAFDDSIGAALLGERSLSAITRPTLFERVWLAPASAELSRLQEMDCTLDADRTDADGHLKDIALWLELNALNNDVYDDVLLDCPTQHAFLHHLALLASTDVIVPLNVATSHLHAVTPDLQMILQAQGFGHGNPVFNGFLPIHTQPRGNWRAQHREADQHAMPHFSPVPFTPNLSQSKLLAAAESISPATAAFRQVARELTYGIAEARQRAALLHTAPRSLTPPSQRLSALGAYR